MTSAFVTKAKNEILKAVVRIGPHDMPQDGMISHRHHRFRTDLGFLAQPRAQAAAEDENWNFRRFHNAALVIKSAAGLPCGPSYRA